MKSLHDLLFELDREWGRFRNGSIISLISSGILFLIIIAIIFRTRHLGLGAIDLLFLIASGAFLAYSIYAMYRQYRFFNRWERRMGLLLHLEEQMLAQKLNDTKT